LIWLRRLALLFIRLPSFCLRIFDPFIIILCGGRIVRHDDLVCVIRIDNIGDYILFRQTLRSLRFSPRLARKKIVFLGNAAWQALAEHLDSDSFDEFIPVNVYRFNFNPLYRARTLLRVKRLGAAIALYPTFSRAYSGDVLIAATGARDKIGFYSLAQNITAPLKYITDRFYTELVDYRETYPFELKRNQEFLHYLGVPPQNIQPFCLVRPTRSPNTLTINNNYLNLPVFFIGAYIPSKRWPMANWLDLAIRLERDYGLASVWLGGRDCEPDMRKIAARLPVGAVNLVGKTSLTDLLPIIADARLVVTNDSMALHCAAMLGVPHIVISNGQHLGRFLPYPADIAPQAFAVLPEEIDSSDPRNIKRFYYTPFPFFMSSISVDRVYATLASLLNNLDK